MLQKVAFPGGQPPGYAFNVILLAEGYLAAEGSAFHGACLDFVERLLLVPPFNLTRINPGWLNVYKRFLPSANAGPAAGPAPAGRTVFESSLDAATGRLTANPARVAAVVDAETVEYGGSILPLNQFVGVSSRAAAGLTLLALLLPAHASAAGGELEYQPGAADYYFVATTQNGEWHQVIMRAMAGMLGLADEFELPGPEFLAPGTGADRAALHPNVIPRATPPLLNKDVARWRPLIGLARQNSPATVHPRTAPPGTPDNTLSAVPTTPSEIEFWEGGEGFRTKVYRSAPDCLMRRRIGDANLPVRGRRVPFCRVCRKFLQDLLS
jgi:hypothetical protein